MGRMAVEPGSAPHWLDGYRGGRGFRNPYGSHKNYTKDKQHEEAVKEEVKEILLKKFNNVKEFTDEQKEKIQNTLKYQIDIFSRAIVEQASETVEYEMENETQSYLDSVQESKDTRRLTEMYYRALREKATFIAEEEYNISDTFDIEEVAKREEKIYNMVISGKITKAEAKTQLEKPILFKNIDERYNKSLMSAYINRETHRSGNEDRGEIDKGDLTR